MMSGRKYAYLIVVADVTTAATCFLCLWVFKAPLSLPERLTVSFLAVAVTNLVLMFVNLARM